MESGVIMDLIEIETFLMIVKMKSITKSAEQLFVTQPTVSHRLKSLEYQLNVKLVIRKKGVKNIELTSKGEEFVAIAERWSILWKELKELENTSEKLFLTIGCIDTLNSTLMIPFYQNVLDSTPSINLNIRTHQSSEIYNLLENHEIDIGIVFHNLYFKKVISVPLLEEELYLVQSKSNCIAKKEINILELDNSKELYFDWDDNYRIWHNQWIKRNENFTIHVDTFQLLLQFMMTGKYWIIAPISVIKELLEYDSFYVSRLINTPGPPNRTTYYIRHKTPKVSTGRAVEKFTTMMKTYLEQMNIKNRIFIEEII